MGQQEKTKKKFAGQWGGVRQYVGVGGRRGSEYIYL